MTFATDMAAVALELLEEFGEAVTLTRPSSSAAIYDPATGIATPVSPATYTGQGYPYRYESSEIDGTNVRVGDQRLLLATSGMVLPQTGDTVIVGGTTYSVVRGRQERVAGTAVFYEAQIRGVA